jgi:hypothetical protein
MAINVDAFKQTNPGRKCCSLDSILGGDSSRSAPRTVIALNSLRESTNAETEIIKIFYNKNRLIVKDAHFS